MSDTIFVDVKDTLIVTETGIEIISMGVQGPAGPQGAPGSGVSVAWGAVTGTLADQTDLVSALDGKSSTSHNHDVAYATSGHTHTGVYAPAVHGHDHNDTSNIQGGTTNEYYHLTSAQLDDLTPQDIAATYTAGGNTTLTYSKGAIYTATAATGSTTWVMNGLVPMSEWTVELTNGGLFGQTWFANTKWDGGTAPTPLTSSGLDIFTFYSRDGVTIRGFLAAKDSK